MIALRDHSAAFKRQVHKNVLNFLIACIYRAPQQSI